MGAGLRRCARSARSDECPVCPEDSRRENGGTTISKRALSSTVVADELLSLLGQRNLDGLRPGVNSSYQRHSQLGFLTPGRKTIHRGSTPPQVSETELLRFTESARIISAQSENPEVRDARIVRHLCCCTDDRVGFAGIGSS